jgi:hypothetical protein
MTIESEQLISPWDTSRLYFAGPVSGVLFFKILEDEAENWTMLFVCGV